MLINALINYLKGTLNITQKGLANHCPQCNG